MLSDVLAEAVSQIDYYFSTYPHYYTDVRERVIAARNELNSIRLELDRPPTENSETKDFQR